MGKRYIRLKEWDLNLDKTMVPGDAFLAEIDGTVLKQPYRIITSSEGFIIDPDRQNTFKRRVVVMGDSVVECTFVRQGYRMTDVAERNLRNLGSEVRVENAGRSGATSLSHLLSLLAKIVPLKPDLIVIMSGVIDADALIHESGFWTKSEYINPLQEELTSAVSSRRCDNLVFSSRSKILRLIVETCHLFGIKVAFATFPLRASDAFRDAYVVKHKGREERLQAINEHTRIFCQDNGVELFDIQEMFKGRSDLFYDLFHLNENGAGILGESFAKFIENVLPQRDM